MRNTQKKKKQKKTKTNKQTKQNMRQTNKEHIITIRENKYNANTSR